MHHLVYLTIGGEYGSERDGATVLMAPLQTWQCRGRLRLVGGARAHTANNTTNLAAGTIAVG